MLLTLKYPRKEKLVQKMHEMHGTIIQVSNKRDFSDAVNIYTLEEKDLNDLIIKAIDISENQNFRYLRLLPLPGKMVNIAILEVYSNIKGNEKIIVGSAPHILSPKENIQSNNKNLSLLKCKSLEDDATVTNVMDGNMETYYVGFTLDLDLGNSMKIDQIRFAPRNANNGIEKGDNYELMYYDNKWISAGIQKAKYNYLQFNDIPSNKIYWLKNMDRGKEELSFIYRDGKQIFINHDDISKYY